MKSRFRSAVVLAIAFAVFALFSIETASGASSRPDASAASVLKGKVPECTVSGAGMAAVLLGGPRLYGPNPGPGTGPDQQPREGRFFDAIGSEYIWVMVDGAQPCPGPPSEIKVLSPIESTSCGSVELLTIEVVDAGGYNVKDGTEVKLTANLGGVPETLTTKAGLAYASYRAPGDASGKAEVIIRAGAVVAFKTLDVSCS